MPIDVDYSDDPVGLADAIKRHTQPGNNPTYPWIGEVNPSVGELALIDAALRAYKVPTA